MLAAVPGRGAVIRQGCLTLRSVQPRRGEAQQQKGPAPRDGRGARGLRQRRPGPPGLALAGRRPSWRKWCPHQAPESEEEKGGVGVGREGRGAAQT